MPTVTIHTPETLNISENGTAQPESKQSSESRLDKLIIANTSFAVWLIFLAIGGGTTALYYARIGYLPEIEWQSVLIYLFIGTVVGGTLGLLLTTSIYIPGVLWSEFIIFDRSLQKHFAYDKKGEEPCIRSVITCLGVPYAWILLISHVMLLVPSALAYWLLAAGILVVTFLLMRVRFAGILIREKRFKGEDGNKRQTHKPPLVEKFRRLLKLRRRFKARQTFKYSSWFTLSVLLSQISMYVIYRLSGSMGISRHFIYLTLFCTAGVCISNHIVALRHHKFPRQAIAAALVAAGLLLGTADKFSSLSVRLMNRYGIGYYQRFNLFVTTDGYRTLQSQGVQQCGEPPQVCNVEILSKAGDHYFLRVNDKIYVTLPKTDVVSIRQLNHP